MYKALLIKSTRLSMKNSDQCICLGVFCVEKPLILPNQTYVMSFCKSLNVLQHVLCASVSCKSTFKQQTIKLKKFK